MDIVGTSIDHLWIQALHTLHMGAEVSSRAGKTRELTGVRLTLIDPERCFLMNRRRNLSPVYAAGEVLWILGGKKGSEICHYAPQYERFLNDGEAHGAYGARLAGQVSDWDETRKDLFLGKKEEEISASQVRALIRMLKNTPNTRQAVLSLWEPTDLLYALSGGINDIPCTLSIQFIRRESLECFVTMRSNDIWLGTPYDMFFFSTLQLLIAEVLDVPAGMLRVSIGSLHLYEKNFKAAHEAALLEPESSPLWKADKQSDFLTSYREAIRCEELNRKEGFNELGLTEGRFRTLTHWASLQGRMHKLYADPISVRAYERIQNAGG